MPGQPGGTFGTDFFMGLPNVQPLPPPLPLPTLPPVMPVAGVVEEPHEQAPAPKRSSRAVTVHDDGYNWHVKSNQRLAKGKVLARYYVCSQKNCQARKNVKFDLDGRIIDTKYRGEHCHEPIQGANVRRLRPNAPTQRGTPGGVEAGTAQEAPIPAVPTYSTYNWAGTTRAPAYKPPEVHERPTITSAQTSTTNLPGGEGPAAQEEQECLLPSAVPSEAALTSLISSYSSLIQHLSIWPYTECVVASQRSLNLLATYGSTIAVDTSSRFTVAGFEVAVVLVGLGSRTSPFAGNDVAPSSVVPVAYLISSVPSHASYSRLLRVLGDKCPRWSPRLFACDFGTHWRDAAISVWSECRCVSVYALVASRCTAILEAVVRAAEPEVVSASAASLSVSQRELKAVRAALVSDVRAAGNDAEDMPATFRVLDGRCFSEVVDDVHAALRRAILAGSESEALDAVAVVAEAVPRPVRPRFLSRFRINFAIGGRVADWCCYQFSRKELMDVQRVHGALQLYSSRLQRIADALHDLGVPRLGDALHPLLRVLAAEIASGETAAVSAVAQLAGREEAVPLSGSVGPAVTAVKHVEKSFGAPCVTFQSPDLDGRDVESPGCSEYD